MHYRPIVRADARPLVVTAQVLTPLERQVVMLAAQDGRDSVCRGGTIRRFFDRLFAKRRVNALADARLEALRRFCVGRHIRATAEQRLEVLAQCARLGLAAETLGAAAALSDLLAASFAGGTRSLPSSEV